MDIVKDLQELKQQKQVIDTQIQTKEALLDDSIKAFLNKVAACNIDVWRTSSEDYEIDLRPFDVTKEKYHLQEAYINSTDLPQIIAMIEKDSLEILKSKGKLKEGV